MDAFPSLWIRLLCRSTLALAAIVGLCACPGMSPKDNQRFQSFIEKTVTPGMALAAAEQRLRRAGFECDDRAAAPDITCTRNRQSLLPYACFQRVNLMPDADRLTVSTVTPKPIGCAGL
jgi:hypothetical protein